MEPTGRGAGDAATRARPTKAERRAQRERERERVAEYHDRELRRLVDHLRAALAELDAGKTEAWEFDDVVHHFRRASQKLWAFCFRSARAGGRRDRLQEREGESPDWWAVGAPRRER